MGCSITRYLWRRCESHDSRVNTTDINKIVIGFRIITGNLGNVLRKINEESNRLREVNEINGLLKDDRAAIWGSSLDRR